jgi:hypothetical protein
VQHPVPEERLGLVVVNVPRNELVVELRSGVAPLDPPDDDVVALHDLPQVDVEGDRQPAAGSGQEGL